MTPYRKFIQLVRGLTVFDVFVWVAILAAGAFGLLVLFRQGATMTITVKVNDESVTFQSWRYLGEGTRPWFAHLFRVGQKEKDGTGRSVAEIIGVRSFDTSPPKKVVYLDVRLKALYNRASGQNTFRGKPVLVGSPIRLALDDMMVEGLVTGINGKPDTRKRERLLVETEIREENPVYAELSGTKQYVADAISVGDTFSDDQGRPIVRVVGKSVTDAERAVTTADGRIVVQTNPLRKQVVLTLDVEATVIGNRYYIYDDIPVLIGLAIPINTPVISVWPEIKTIRPYDETTARRLAQ